MAIHYLQVKILEASGRVGGRVKDNFSLGPCIGLGAMFITGINNNPLTLLSHQLGVKLRYTNEDCCELISESGWKPEPALDKQVEAHFNKALDKLAEWRKLETKTDVSLGGKDWEWWGWGHVHDHVVRVIWMGLCDHGVTFPTVKLAELHHAILENEREGKPYSEVRGVAAPCPYSNIISTSCLDGEQIA